MRIVAGDIFQRRTDIIVLPTSRSGSLTRGIRQGAARARLLRTLERVELGEVRFFDTPDSSLSLFVAWAASVAQKASSFQAIVNVCRQVSEFADKVGAQSISVPLLGANAGGLSERESAIAIQEGFGGNDPRVTLFILEPDAASRVAAFLGVGAGDDDEPARIVEGHGTTPNHSHTTPAPPTREDVPTCFISYSWDDEPHKAWVLKLASDLRQDHGIDVKLDRWGIRPGTQIAEFMERSLRESDYVVLVCTPKYVSKSNAESGGVGYEKQIVTAQILQGQSHERFIPAVRKGSDVPTYWGTKCWIDFRDDSKYLESVEELARAVHKAPKLVPPPLGARRF